MSGLDDAGRLRQSSSTSVVALGSGLVVYFGQVPKASAHSHDAIQFAWCPTTTLEVTTELGLTESHTVLVPSRQLHELAAVDEAVVMLVEPAGPLGRRLGRLALDHTNEYLSDKVADIELAPPGDAGSLIGWSRSVLDRLIGEQIHKEPKLVRPELLKAQRFIDAGLHSRLVFADAAQHVGLSPRQLRRSFTEEIGIPYRRYVLWRRLRQALLTAHSGANLTTAAASAGFADSAHLSRTFRRTFGLSPSDVLPLVEVVEADFPGAA